MAINLKPIFDKLMEAVNAGGKRLEEEVQQFGYSYAKEFPAEEKEETDKE